jgi:hypothetical protein
LDNNSQEKPNAMINSALNDLALLRVMRRIQDLQKERDFARPHLEKLKEWTAISLYSLANQFNCIQIVSRDEGKFTSISDLNSEAARLHNLFDVHRRSQKTNHASASQSQSQPMHRIQSQDNFMDDPVQYQSLMDHRDPASDMNSLNDSQLLGRSNSILETRP